MHMRQFPQMLIMSNSCYYFNIFLFHRPRLWTFSMSLSAFPFYLYIRNTFEMILRIYTCLLSYSTLKKLTRGKPLRGNHTLYSSCILIAPSSTALKVLISFAAAFLGLSEKSLSLLLKMAWQVLTSLVVEFLI